MGDLTGIDWDNSGFHLVPMDYMYVMKCNLGGEWRNMELQPFGNPEISACARVLNYGQVRVCLLEYFLAALWCAKLGHNKSLQLTRISFSMTSIFVLLKTAQWLS